MATLLQDMVRLAESDATAASPIPFADGLPWPFVVSQLLSPFTTAAWIVLLLWIFRSARTAMRLGIPARRSPGWAVGAWFVPIVNFWWPMQSLRDLLPPDDPWRRKVTLLWVASLVAGVVQVVGFIVAFLGPPGTAWVGVAGVAVTVLAVLSGRGLVSHALQVHERLVESLPS